eukprot:385599-Pleurochrysis_carterae.AAC.1
MDRNVARPGVALPKVCQDSACSKCEYVRLFEALLPLQLHLPNPMLVSHLECVCRSHQPADEPTASANNGCAQAATDAGPQSALHAPSGTDNATELRPELLNVVTSHEIPRAQRQRALRGVEDREDMQALPSHLDEVAVGSLYFVASPPEIVEGNLRIGLARVTKDIVTNPDNSQT